MHIYTYLFIIVVNIVQAAELYKVGMKACVITTICKVVIFFICTLVFGLIVNTIVPKIKAADIQGSLSIPSSLIS